FAPNGALVAAGSASQTGSAFGHAFQGGPFIVEFDRSGTSIWVFEFTGATGHFTGLGTSAVGTVVAAARLAGAYPFGAFNGLSGDVLLTIESDGTPRWERELFTEDGPGWRLAVDPAGV